MVRSCGVIEIVEFGAELRLFREQAYLRGKRDPEWTAEWGTDEHDERATHFVVRDEDGALAGAVRAQFDPPWPDGVDDEHAVLFARMAVRRMELRGRRVLVDLMLHANRHAAELGRTTGYAVANSRALWLYRRIDAQFDVVSGPNSGWGSEMYLMRWELERFAAALESVVDIRRAVPLPG
ncbi:hypothetical protein FKR81_41875 [Lentzea tibetensis]|uniref:N-acetyltransferase domain-containing protein n=1 Tax=Lentzea tibetensis TaxID=2591470 RepID=A0A563EFR9_9PSEU|nr:hypothetical protein [Lentzea tibetensis]TWP43988.1 hypothetical protein FKR81_41875 [Lentzea tibetensis]